MGAERDRDEARAREKDREIYTAGGEQRDACPWLGALLSSRFISAVLVCAAESRQTDTQRPYDMAHIPGTFSMGYKPSHNTQPSQAYSCTQPSANSTAVICGGSMQPPNRFLVTDKKKKMNGQSRVWNKSQRRRHSFCCLVAVNGSAEGKWR